MKKYVIGITVGILGAIILLVVGLALFLTITEYTPEDRQAPDRLIFAEDGKLAGKSLSICTWNIGYAGLGKDSDSFLDGGKMVDPPSQQAVETNISEIQRFIQQEDADIWLLQELDVNSARTDSMDQFEKLSEAVGGSAAFAYNYKCPFVPIPLPPIGRVEAGVATLSELKMTDDAERISLPCPFSWPMRAANLKRCLLVTRIPVEGSDNELVIVNLHLEAYDDGEGKAAQTKILLDVMREEYEKGNYVIAGGDFNQSFPGMLDKFPVNDSELWQPGLLDNKILPEGWQYAYDKENATCRSLDQPYFDECQKYAIDGFIISPNVQLDSVEAIPLEFEHSDHNPVRLTVTLLN